MSNLPLHGALSDNKLEVIEKGGVVISGDKIIEVGSFKTGYVRNQNSGYSNYQLNKRLKEIDNQNLIIYNFLTRI